MRQTYIALALFPGLRLLLLVIWRAPTTDVFVGLAQLLGVVAAGVILGVVAIFMQRKVCKTCGSRALATFSLGEVECGKCAPGKMLLFRRIGNAVAIVLLPVVVLTGAWTRFDTSAGEPREPNPIGDVSDRNWDKESCRTSDFMTRPNEVGMVAVARDSFCSFGFGVGVKNFYVFVRPAREKNSRENLVLRFEGIHGMPPPLLKWLTNSRLRISYAADVSQVTRQASNVDGITIEYNPNQPYAAFVINQEKPELQPELQINPEKNSLAIMTFDLLPLPEAPPSRPFARNREFSIFGCDDELSGVATPALSALEAYRQRLELLHASTGSYPFALPIKVVRGVAYAGEGRDAKLVLSNRVPGLRVIYHRTADSYALEMRFPDLQPNYRSPTDYFDSRPGSAFLSCMVVHTGTSGK